MEILFQFTTLLVGLILLWKTGDQCVRHALGFSAIYGIEQFTVGFVIFAISTGLPEISSAIVSTLSEVPELSTGTLLGSTFSNLSLILGILCLFQMRIDISSQLRRKLYKTTALMALIILWLLIFPTGNLWTAFVLIFLYIGSIFWFQSGLPKEVTKAEIKEVEKEIVQEEKKAWITPKIDILLKLAVSLGLLLISSWITVHGATKLSEILGWDLTLIGGSLLAVGTSLPELALEINAVKRKEYGLALGDLFGSSLLNISLVLGVFMLMNPQLELGFAWKVLPFLGAIFVWVVQALFRKQAFSRKDSFFFLGTFAVYIAFIILFDNFT